MHDQKRTIIAISMATFLFVTISLSIIGYLISFTKKEFKKHFINKKILIILFTMLGINLPFIIVGFTLQFNIILFSQAALITIIIIAFGLTISVGIYVFLFLQTIAIGINDKEIVFLGERILIRKITKIERNDKTNRLIIYYIEGNRSKKKCNFLLSSKNGQFIINNVNLLNQEITIFTSNTSATTINNYEQLDVETNVPIKVKNDKKIKKD